MDYKFIRYAGKYPFCKLEKYASHFKFPADELLEVRSAAHEFAKRYGGKFEIGKVKGKWRCTQIDESSLHIKY